MWLWLSAAPLMLRSDLTNGWQRSLGLDVFWLGRYCSSSGGVKCKGTWPTEGWRGAKRRHCVRPPRGEGSESVSVISERVLDTSHQTVKSNWADVRGTYVLFVLRVCASTQSNVYWPNIHSINLTLFNISRDDNNFQLTCIAENVVGMTNSSIQLNVRCKLICFFLWSTLSAGCSGDESELKPSTVLQVADGLVTRFCQNN